MILTRQSKNSSSEPGLAVEQPSWLVVCLARRCYSTNVVPQTLVVDGDFTVRPDNGVTGYPRLTADQCYSLCRHQLAPRYCIGVNYRPDDGACLQVGYQLVPNNRSVHFRRICQAGLGRQ